MVATLITVDSRAAYKYDITDGGPIAALCMHI